MAENDPIPSRESDFAVFYANLAVKLPGYAVPLTLLAADVTRVTNAAPWVANIFPAVEQARNEAKEYTAYKQMVLFGDNNGTLQPVPGAMPPPTLSPILNGLVDFLRGLIAAIKTRPAYTPAIGADLGIVATPTPPPAVPKPTGSVESLGNYEARVKFKKAGFSGVEVWCQRAGETVWVRIATDSYSPYVDNRPPLVAGAPEERRYRLRYLDKDEPVGEFSDVFSCVVGA
jgi:hypothetical protein